MTLFIVLGIVLLALVLFLLDTIPIEVSSLMIVCLLAITRVLAPEQAFEGFSNDTVISFITPLEPSCVLVNGPAHYRFTDLFRLGTPLTAVLVAGLVFVVPVVWPFHAKARATPRRGAHVDQVLPSSSRDSSVPRRPARAPALSSEA